MRGCDESTHLQGYDLRRSILCLVRLLHECSLRLLQLVHVERELLLLVVGLVLQYMHSVKYSPSRVDELYSISSPAMTSY
jgi:hypothetical protein